MKTRRTITEQIGTTPNGTAVLVPKRRSKGLTLLKPQAVTAKPQLKHRKAQAGSGKAPSSPGSFVYRVGRMIELPRLNAAAPTQSSCQAERPIIDAIEDNPFVDLNSDFMNDDSESLDIENNAR